MRKTSIKIVALLLVMLVCIPTYSYAQCSSPAGQAGEREWSSGDSVYQLCNGNNWVDFSCKDYPGCTPSSIAYEAKLTNGSLFDQFGGSALSEDKSKMVLVKRYQDLIVLDVSSPPAAPTLLGSNNDSDYNDASDLEVFGTYAFIAARYGGGFVAANFGTITELGIVDTLTSATANQMTNIWGVGLTEDGRYAVTTSWGSGASGNQCWIHVIDISDPYALSEVGSTNFDGVTGASEWCVDVAVYGDYAFVAFDEAGGALGVVDISTKSSPSALSYTTMTAGGRAQSIILSEDGQYAFTSNGDDSVTSFDISDPTSVSYSDNYLNATYLGDGADLTVAGNTLIAVGNTDNGIVVLDISDPTNMTLIDTYSGATNNDEPEAVEIVGRYAYVAADGTATAVAVYDLGCDASSGGACNTLGACSTSAQMEWDGTETAYRYCDGSDWVEVGCDGSTCPASLGACSTAGQVTYSSNVLYQCDGSNWNTMVDPTRTIVLTSGSSWTVPADWNNSNNTIHVIGGGGGGSAVNGGGGGGGGGGYARAENVTLTPSGTVSYSIGSGGSAGDPGGNGGDTWFCNSTSNCASVGGTAVVAGATGGDGGGTTGGSGGGGPGGDGSVGDVQYSAGSGGYSTDWGGGGGGGAAGPYGYGGPGGYTEWESGGGGGAGGGGSEGGDVINNDDDGSYGGASFYSSGAGVSGGPTGDGGNGSNGGGGAGGGGDAATSGGNGGNGIEWGTAGSGGGGGGAGSIDTNTSDTGGDGGLYGGGGAGMGQQGGDAGAGAQGVIVIQYTP